MGRNLTVSAFMKQDVIDFVLYDCAIIWQYLIHADRVIVTCSVLRRTLMSVPGQLLALSILPCVDSDDS